MKAAQRLAQSALALSERGSRGSTAGGRAIEAAGNFLRRLLLRRGDPVVAYRLDGARLLLPLSHDLPYFRRTFPDYSANVGRLASALHGKYGSDLRIVDIGANVGDTVAVIRAHIDSPILCIEGHPGFADLLRRNAATMGGVAIERAIVGAVRSTSPVELRAHRGTAGVAAGDRPADVVTLPDVLARRRDFAEAKLLKIDTDGWDLEILAGAREWIERVRPVLFFEWDPALAMAAADRVAIEPRRDLGELGYEQLMVFANEGDFVLACSPTDPVLTDVLAYFSGTRRRRYCDIAAFPSEDLDVFDQLCRGERARMRS